MLSEVIPLEGSADGAPVHFIVVVEPPVLGAMRAWPTRRGIWESGTVACCTTSAPMYDRLPCRDWPEALRQENSTTSESDSHGPD